MKSVRSLLSAVALLVAFVGAPIAPAFAAAPRQACATSAHACCHTASIRACCSTPARDSNQGTPAQSRVQVVQPLVATPAIFVMDAHPDLLASVRPQTTPPLGGRLDLPTLLSTLLI